MAHRYGNLNNIKSMELYKDLVNLNDLKWLYDPALADIVLKIWYRSIQSKICWFSYRWKWYPINSYTHIWLIWIAIKRVEIPLYRYRINMNAMKWVHGMVE